MVNFGELRETLEEPERSALADVEVNGLKDAALHVENLIGRILFAGNINEVLERGWINLLVLGDHE